MFMGFYHLYYGNLLAQSVFIGKSSSSLRLQQVGLSIVPTDNSLDHKNLILQPSSTLFM